MASIYANGSKGHHKFTLTVNETSTSVENNTSTISFSFKLSPIISGYDWLNWTNANRTVSYNISVNGTTYTGTIPNYDGTSTVTLKSGTQTVAHNSDGAKTISYYFSVTDTAGMSYTCGNASATGTLALTTLERPSSDAGSSGGSSGASPIITASVVDTNNTTIALTGNSSKLIKYHSAARATMSAEPQHGAAIDENLYIIRNGSETGYGVSHTFYNVESNVFNFSAEDDRGFIGTKTVTASMVNYIRLTCNIGNNRPDASGKMTLVCTGNYFNSSFGAKSNTLSVKYSYTGSDGSSAAGNMSVTKSGNTYTARANLSGLNYQTSYSFYITATDELEEVTSSTTGVKSKPIFHWGENDFAFEVPVNFNTTDTTRFKGDLRLKGDGNYGNTLYFGDGSYCYISEPTDDSMEISADSNLSLGSKNILLSGMTINLSSGDIQIKGNSITNIWFPVLYSSAVSSYSVQDGWYLRIANVVTIGWNIKATIKSGYHNTDLVISGVPVTPIASAFGGGVAHNIYIRSGGYIFEGWGINTSGQITARLQPCTETSAGNLEIASACGYPVGGGVVSLAGTICYMAY